MVLLVAMEKLFKLIFDLLRLHECYFALSASLISFFKTGDKKMCLKIYVRNRRRAVLPHCSTVYKRHLRVLPVPM